MEETIERPVRGEAFHAEGEWAIPEGYEAEIKDGKIIVRKKESEDERIRKMLVEQMERWKKCAEENNVEQDVKDASAAIAWLEKQKEQQPAEWSEEDEHRLKDSIYFLESAMKHYADTSEIEKTIYWLKSLRPQPRWKPSKEQMEAMESAVKLYKDTHFEIHHDKIVSLYEQLKKL